jgi:hypothetical protein
LLGDNTKNKENRKTLQKPIKTTNAAGAIHLNNVPL